MNKDQEELVFAAALQRTGTDRAGYLDLACAGDPDVRRRIENRLIEHAEAQAATAETSQATTRPDLTRRLDPEPGSEMPERIGRYKILQKIGEGGCGVVYVADQEEPVRRRVAIKVVKPGTDTKQVLARFEAERQALALMDHPNIAKVLDAGATESGRPFFVMELVKGVRITDYCDQHHLSTRDRLALFCQVCQAIQHAHQKGIIHRDIKPSNILVAEHDGVPVPKVIDFGIAKATTGQQLTDKTLFTALEQFIGTPAYMSPEQAKIGGLELDVRSDIYSLGVLLYELLTGKTPFDAKRLIEAGYDEIRRIIREEEPPRPSTRISTLDASEQSVLAKLRQSEPPKLRHLIRGDLDWIVMKCLEKDRTRRYEGAGSLSRDLQNYLTNQPIEARPPSTLYRLQKHVRRNKVVFASVAGLAAAVAAGIALGTWRADRAKAPVSSDVRRETNLLQSGLMTRTGEVAQPKANGVVATKSENEQKPNYQEVMEKATNALMRAESARIRNNYDEALRELKAGVAECESVGTNNATQAVIQLKGSLQKKLNEVQQQIEVQQQMQMQMRHSLAMLQEASNSLARAESALNRTDFDMALMELDKGLKMTTFPTHIGASNQAVQLRAALEMKRKRVYDAMTVYPAAMKEAETAYAQKNYLTASNHAAKALSYKAGDTNAQQLMLKASLANTEEERTFQAALKAAREALADKEYSASIAILDEALKLKPNATEASQLKQQSLAEVMKLKEQAEQARDLPRAQGLFATGDYAAANDLCKRYGTNEEFGALAKSIREEQEVFDAVVQKFSVGYYSFAGQLKEQPIAGKKPFADLIKKATEEKLILDELRAMQLTNGWLGVQAKLAASGSANYRSKPPFQELNDLALKEIGTSRMDADLEMLLVQFNVRPRSNPRIRTAEARKATILPDIPIAQKKVFMERVNALEKSYATAGRLDKEIQDLLKRLKANIENY